MTYFRYAVLSLSILFCTATIIVSCNDDGPSNSISRLDISAVTPDSGFVGDKVTVNASGLVPQPEDNIVRFDGIRAPVSSVSQGRLVTEVPAGATSGTISLEVDGVTAQGPFFKVLIPALAITGVTPTQGRPGARITITGENFLPPSAVPASVDSTTSPSGSSLNDSSLVSRSEVSDANQQLLAENLTVTFNGVEASVISATPTQIITEVPRDVKDGPIEIQSGDRTAVFPNFDVILPEITSIAPQSGMEGTKVTITGKNFSPAVDSNSVAFNGTEASVTGASETRIVTSVPGGAKTGPVTLTSAGQIVTGPVFKVRQNQPPEITSSASFKLDENHTKAGTIKASDPDGDPLTFSLSGGTDKSLFTIDISSGKLAFKAAPDFENPGDANKDNNYEVTVQVSDGTETATQNLTITVTDVNENQAPTITSAASFKVDENQTAVGTIKAKDPNGDTLTFSLSGGDDQGLFSIDKNSGALAFKTAPDFEKPGDANKDNVYQVQVSASDGSESATQNLTITVTDVNENEAPSITSGASFKVDENKTAVGTIKASDPNGDTLTFSLSGGDDQGLFSIDKNSGALAFKTAPDFEKPGDANKDNTYEVTVQVSDGTETATQNLTITVTDVNENEAPKITSGATFKIAENKTAVGTITATDPNGDTLTFGLSGGGDQSLFSIDKNSGALAFKTAPDFENPGDANKDNTYEVTVQVSDGTETATQNLTITVTDVNENQAPTITSKASFKVDENQTAVGMIKASDPNGDTLTFSLSGGDDQGLFSIDKNRGALAFKTAPDFEKPGDANTDNVYQVQVSASDGTESATQNLTIMVTDVNENQPPGITSKASFKIAENKTAVGTIKASDPNGDTLTFSLSGGDDQSLFSIDKNSGALAFKTAPDFENPTDANTDNEYHIMVQVTDGSLNASQDLTITVTNINDNPPTITSGTSFDVDENQTDVATITASDPDGDALTFSLSGGADKNKFNINATSGQLTFNAAPDFGNPGDANKDNTYQVQVQVSDGSETATQDVSVTVQNVPDPLSFKGGLVQLTPGGTSYLADSPNFIFDAMPAGTDLSSVHFFYITIYGVNLNTQATFSGPDGASFSMKSVSPDSSIIKLSGPTLDYNHSAGGPHQYKFTMTVTNPGGQPTSQTFIIPVQKPNEKPVITSSSTFNVNENKVGIGTITASDPDGDALTFSLSGGADRNKFSIDGSSGALSFSSAPDFEKPADANSNNVYQAQVQVSDGTDTTFQQLTVSVQDIAGDPYFSTGEIYINGVPYNPINYSHIDAPFSLSFFPGIPNGTDLSPASDTNLYFTLVFKTPDMAASGQSFILSGPDQNSFQIVHKQYGRQSVIQLKFKGGNNGVVEYNNPHDANKDHKYEFTITVDDGMHNPPSQQKFILPIRP